MKMHLLLLTSVALLWPDLLHAQARFETIMLNADSSFGALVVTNDLKIEPFQTAELVASDFNSVFEIHILKNGIVK